MTPDKFFVQIVDKGNRGKVQEVDPRLFELIRQTPRMDVSTTEPNLLTLERYPALGYFHPTAEVLTYYAGVSMIGGHDLLPSHHHFLAIMSAKLKPNKKKAIVVSDYAVTAKNSTPTK